MKKSNAIVYSPIMLVMVIVLVLSLHMHWQGDAVAFSFFIPAENEDFSFIPLNNVWEIWPSMCNHWHNSTGRFFTQAVVQLFCAFIGKTGFAICNAAIWGGLILLLIRMARLKSPGFSLTAVASLLTFIIFFPLNDFKEQSLPFEPPHQINYVWMGLWNMAWIYIFLWKSRKKIGWIKLMLLAVFSFLGGQANESFSIPIGGAILIYACSRKFNLSLCQYVMAICYGIGALLVIFAPSNFQRFGDGAPWSLFYTAESLIPGLLIFVLWLVSILVWRKTGKPECVLAKGNILFISGVIIINFLLGIFLGLRSGVRMLTCANLLITVLILINIRKVRFNPIVTACVVLLTLFMGIYRYIAINKLNDKNIMIEDLYHKSDDGVVVLPNNMFLYQVREFIVRPHPFMMLERSVNPSKPNIAIRPQSMMKLNLATDTNLLVPLSEQAWLMVQSRRHPAEFIIEKTLLPGILNRQIAPRQMDWDDPYAVFDSTELWRAAIYVNERPYLRSKISMYEK